MAAQLLWDAVTTFQGSTWNAELRPPCLSLSLLESLFKVLQALLWGDSEFSHQINEFWWVFLEHQSCVKPWEAVWPLAGAVAQTHLCTWAAKFHPWSSSQITVAFAKDRMVFCVLPVGSSCSDPLVALQPVLRHLWLPQFACGHLMCSSK